MDILFFLIWSSLCLYVAWWHGHKSAWGKLHYLHHVPDPGDMTLIKAGFSGYRNIEILQNEKRTGGWAINLYVNKQGMLFNSIKYFRYFIPSFFIPWTELLAIEENNHQCFMRQRMSKLTLPNNIAVLIPHGNYTDQLLSFIKDNGLTYGANKTLNADATP
jgi:hypothetical protein